VHFLGWKVTAKILDLLHLLPAVKALNRLLRLLTAWGHRMQFTMEWVTTRHPPEWFDHFLDDSWKWHVSRNPLSWERGVFGSLAMEQGCRVLDLCCGGGFITYHFFSGRAASIVAVDFDPKAIAHARRNFIASNLVYRCADIRTDMPEGEFDNVSWDAAIEHFTETEIAQIIGNIKRRLTLDGVLSGYTIIEKATGKSHIDHEYEFKSKEDLARLLRRFFTNVRVFETQWSDQFEERGNLYFWAGDGALPFDDGWTRQTRGQVITNSALVS
jgi:SAM-dependent methyltransferase